MIIQSLQAALDKYMEDEVPRVHAFEDQLYRLAELLRKGDISQKDFFAGLMGDGKPLSTMVRIQIESGSPEWIDLKRTASKKLRVSTHGGSWSHPDIIAWVGLNKRGELTIQRTEAEYPPDDEDPKPRRVKGDLVATDVIGHGYSKRGIAESILEALLQITPPPEEKGEMG